MGYTAFLRLIFISQKPCQLRYAVGNMTGCLVVFTNRLLVLPFYPHGCVFVFSWRPSRRLFIFIFTFIPQ